MSAPNKYRDATRSCGCAELWFVSALTALALGVGGCWPEEQTEDGTPAPAAASIQPAQTPGKPATPRNLDVAESGMDWVTLRWQDASDDVLWFRISVGHGQLQDTQSTQKLKVSPDTTEYRVEDLALDDTYYFQVCATNDAGSSDWSNCATWQSLALRDPVVLRAPETLAVDAFAGEFEG